MAQIFISYAREDFQQAKSLYQQLAGHGFSPWMDKVDLVGGQQWRPAIEQAIRKADFFLLLLSRHSVKKRGFVQREIRAALDLWKDKLADDIYLIPLMLEAMPWAEVPTEISEFQWIEHYETDGWEQLQRALDYGISQRGLSKKPVILVPPPATPMVATELTQPKPQPVIVNLSGGVKLELLPIPGGAFEMGSNESHREKPIHRVTIAPFYLGKFQVTQAQWLAVIGGDNPSRFKGGELPVESVSWHDVMKFCETLSQQTDRSFRLPTEAEWEYACRAGSSGKWCFGDDENLLKQYAWYGEDWDKGKTHPVGQKQANAFGLFDMHGNVWEWCEDVWHDNYNGAPTNGAAWLSGGDSKSRVLRGGSWYYVAALVRSAHRNGLVPGDRLNRIGFRVVLSARTL